MAFDHWPTRRYNRVLRRACLMTGLQACPRGFAPSRRAQGRERIPVLPHLFALHHWLQSPLWGSWIFEGFSSSAELKSFLLSTCIDALESTTNSRSSGIFQEGAGITHASVGELNVALSLFLTLWTFFAKSQASLRAHLSSCKVS